MVQEFYFLYINNLFTHFFLLLVFQTFLLILVAFEYETVQRVFC